MIALENKYDYFWNVPECIKRSHYYFSFETELMSVNYEGEVITFTNENSKFTGKVIEQYNHKGKTHFKCEHVDKIPEEMKKIGDLRM